MGPAACGKIFFGSPVNIIAGNRDSEKNLINLPWLKIKRTITNGGTYFFNPDKSFDRYSYTSLIIPEKTVADFHIKPKDLPSSVRLKLITLLAAGPIAAGSCNYMFYKENLSAKYVDSTEFEFYVCLFKITMIWNGLNNCLNLLPVDKNADGYKILQLTGMSHSSIKKIKNLSINGFLATGLLLSFNNVHRKFNHD